MFQLKSVISLYMYLYNGIPGLYWTVFIIPYIYTSYWKYNDYGWGKTALLKALFYDTALIFTLTTCLKRFLHLTTCIYNYKLPINMCIYFGGKFFKFKVFWWFHEKKTHDFNSQNANWIQVHERKPMTLVHVFNAFNVFTPTANLQQNTNVNGKY